jgi:hypothetical protein
VGGPEAIETHASYNLLDAEAPRRESPLLPRKGEAHAASNSGPLGEEKLAAERRKALPGGGLPLLGNSPFGGCGL